MLEYPSSEKIPYKANADLLNAWKNDIKDRIKFNDYSENDFVIDGFNPFYFSQKIKILYIGLESRGKEGFDYNDKVTAAYNNNSKISNMSINVHPYHKRILKITFGIEKDKNWNIIPRAKDIAKYFGKKDGVSFSTIELSKLVNKTADGKANYEIVERFIEISKKKQENYWNKQIKIMRPDIIITMNLKTYIERGVFGEIQKIDTGIRPHKYYLDVDGKNILMLDSYHFSHRLSKDDEENLYNKIRASIKNLI
jgi:hypothetical protein